MNLRARIIQNKKYTYISWKPLPACTSRVPRVRQAGNNLLFGAINCYSAVDATSSSYNVDRCTILFFCGNQIEAGVGLTHSLLALVV